MNENCERIKNLLNEYRLETLGEKEKAEVEFHLLVCPECIFLLTLVPSLSPDR